MPVDFSFHPNNVWKLDVFQGEKSGLLPEIILKNAPPLPLYVR